MVRRGLPTGGQSAQRGMLLILLGATRSRVLGQARCRNEGGAQDAHGRAGALCRTRQERRGAYRADLQAIERRRRDGEVSADHNVLVTMQQKAQRELKRCEDAVNIATTVLGERRQ